MKRLYLLTLSLALLCLLLCQDREAALFFALLGWYPIDKPALDRLRPLPRVLTKLTIFCAATAAVYGLLILVFQLEALVEEAREMGTLLLVLLAAGGAAAFLLYDRVLVRLTAFYRLRTGTRGRTP